MGANQSSEGGRYGFHVLKVKENSPAYHAGIEQFFDYIIRVNDISVENGDSQTLTEVLTASEDTPIPIDVYSSKDQTIRRLTITPTKKWHNGNDPTEKSLIGCSIRYCSYEKAGEHVWHVLSVAPNSPAEMAGILPKTDYIIGCPHMVLRSEDDFYTLVEEFLGRPLRLYLYNTEWDSCREAIIVPNREWGGEGSLGCDIGYGLLHRIPRKAPSERSQSVDQARNSNEHAVSSAIFSSADPNSAPATSSQTEHASTPLDEEHEHTSKDHEEQADKGHGESTQQSPTEDKASHALLQEAQDTALPESPHPQ